MVTEANGTEPFWKWIKYACEDVAKLQAFFFILEKYLVQSYYLKKRKRRDAELMGFTEADQRVLTFICFANKRLLKWNLQAGYPLNSCLYNQMIISKVEKNVNSPEKYCTNPFLSFLKLESWKTANLKSLMFVSFSFIVPSLKMQTFRPPPASCNRKNHCVLKLIIIS